MSMPPQHVQAFRVVLVLAVVAVLGFAAVAIPWDEVVRTLDPSVDGLRRLIWS